MKYILMLFIFVSLNANIEKCKICHGERFEKKASKNSRIVADLTKKEIRDVLEDYLHGKGGKRKAIMFGQVKNIKNTKDVAEEICSSIKCKKEKEKRKIFLIDYFK